jgi:hypothetical protein
MFQSDRLISNSADDYFKIFNPSYNNKEFGADFYFRALKYYEDKQGYIQPYQQSDIIYMQWLSTDSTLSGFQLARILDEKGSAFTAKTVTVVKDTGTYSANIGGTYTTGLTLYYVRIQLYDVPEGRYFLQLRYGTGTTHYNVITEPFHVKQIHQNTIAIDYTNSYNDQSMIFPSASYIPRLRVHGCITDPDSMAEFNVYEDQPMNAEMVSGIPYRLQEFIIGLSAIGIPKHLEELINRITLFDTTSYDGKLFTREKGSKLEAKNTPGNPLSQYTLKLRERINTSTLEIGYMNVVLGDLPQTNYFWVERIQTATSYTNIRLGFKGKRNFLDYLNTNFYVLFGYWGEDANNKLVFTAYESYTIAGTWTLDAVDVLKYGIKFLLDGTGDLGFDLTAVSGSQFYAVNYGDGTTVNKTALTNTPTITTISHTYAVNNLKEAFIYFSEARSISDNASTIKCRLIGGDLPSSMIYFIPFSSTQYVERFENNIFNYVVALVDFDIRAYNMNTYSINDMIRWIYDSLTRFSTSAIIYMNSQQVSAPPSKQDKGIASFIGAIINRVNTFVTD